MKQNHADITIVLDRSGSMSNVATDTIGGFNTFLDSQKKTPGTATFTLHQFDGKFETVVNAEDIQKVQDLTSKTFVPRGMTALLDAIGRSVTDAGARLEKLPEGERPAKVIFVILTDGYENSSREFTREQIFKMVEHQKEKYSWEFVYLGANQDAIQVGGSLGINAQSSMTYASNTLGTQALYRGLGGL